MAWPPLVLAGTRRDALPDGHYFSLAAGAGLWFGAVDDLVLSGAPAGEGGPWKDTAIKAGEVSDPFLMTNFGRKSVALSHDRSQGVRFTIRGPRSERLARACRGRGSGRGDRPAQLPGGFRCALVRLKADAAVTATAWFTYQAQRVPLAPCAVTTGGKGCAIVGVKRNISTPQSV